MLGVELVFDCSAYNHRRDSRGQSREESADEDGAEMWNSSNEEARQTEQGTGEKVGHAPPE